MKMIRKSIAIFALVIAVAAPTYAKDGNHGHGHGHGKGKANSEQVRFRIPLKPSNVALTDLASAKGRIDFRSKGGKRQFKVKVAIPVPALSLGVADAATAQAAAIHLEISRAAAVINDCTLAFAPSDDLDEQVAPTSARYRAHGRVGGSENASRMIKGTCAAGVPDLQLGDSVIVYGIVNSVRVDFLAQ